MTRIFSAALFLCLASNLEARELFETTRNVDGKNYLLVGTGNPTKLSKGYVMGLYIEETDGRRAFPALATRVGRDHKKLVGAEQTPSFIIWGHFPKSGVLHFTRALEAGEVQSTFRDSLKDEVSDKAPADLRKATEAFLQLFAEPFESGEDIEISTWPDGKISVFVAGEKKELPANVKLARAIWEMWLGPKPISSEMKKQLVENIDTLGPNK